MKGTENCTMHGCDYMTRCDVCGFNRTEAARRRTLPWSVNTDGLRYKFIGQVEVETEQAPAHWEQAGDVFICSSCGFQTLFPGGLCQKCGAVNAAQE